MVFTKGPIEPFFIDNAPVIFPWFSGKEKPMNRQGDRNFCLVLTQEQADMLKAANYQVKILKPREGDEGDIPEQKYFLQCKLNFKSRKPPRVVLVTCIDGVCKRTPMNEDNIMLLDSADIDFVDCKIAPYDREESDTRTAYVQSLFVTVNLDKFDAKYDNLPMDASSPVLEAAADEITED